MTKPPIPKKVDLKKTPREQGYFFPAEWHPHEATWLSWPHKEASWPGKIHSIYPVYSEFIRLLTLGENVCINVNDEAMKRFAIKCLEKASVELSKVKFFIHPTNDAWARDHGPSFLLNKDLKMPKVIVDWGYNAWGGKYPPFDLDDEIPSLIAKSLNLPCYKVPLVMEGGSVDFNGAGTLLTTKACLLNPNRNPDFSQEEIENALRSYYGVEQILWLEDGIEGDDTDGHIDDLTRFINEDTVVTVIEKDKSHPDYEILKQNAKALNKMKLLNGKPLNVIEIPMPLPFIYEDQHLPCSYANFYISNRTVIVPIFEDPHDEKALEILSACFKDREVVGLNSRDIIWGLGSFHCLSQQEPKA